MWTDFNNSFRTVFRSLSTSSAINTFPYRRDGLRTSSVIGQKHTGEHVSAASLISSTKQGQTLVWRTDGEGVVIGVRVNFFIGGLRHLCRRNISTAPEKKLFI